MWSTALEAAGYPMPDPYFVTAFPAGMALGFVPSGAGGTRAAHRRGRRDRPRRPLPARCCIFPVILPGRSGCGRNVTGTLFSGDAIYDGPLLDELPESSIDDYCTTMDRLMTLPVTVVHAGHDPSFGRDRLHELATAYLNVADSEPNCLSEVACQGHASTV